MTTPLRIDSFTLAERVRDVLRCRAQVGGRAAFSFGELADTLFARWASDGRPTKAEVKRALNIIGLGYRLKVVDGRIIYRP